MTEDEKTYRFQVKFLQALAQEIKCEANFDIDTGDSAFASMEFVGRISKCIVWYVDSATVMCEFPRLNRREKIYLEDPNSLERMEHILHSKHWARWLLPE